MTLRFKGFWPIFAVITALLALLHLFAELHPGPHGYGEAHIGGHFTLTNRQGHTVSDQDFHGRLMLVYMGYSNCPDVCPTTLAMMSATLKNLGADADKVAMIFISLDPERDTPQVLKTFLASFDPRITGLTGSQEDIRKVARAYAAYYKKAPTPNTGSYLVDHSGFLYLMDGEGKYITHFESDAKAPELIKAIREHF